MADEAVVRIILDDGGGPPTAPTPAGAPGSTKPSAPPPPPNTAPPPPPAGHARFYHGSASGNIAGNDLTPDLAYAQGYAGKGGDQGKVYYVDVPENHPSLTKAFDDTGMSQKAPYNPFKADPALHAQFKPYDTGAAPQAAPTPSQLAPVPVGGSPPPPPPPVPTPLPPPPPPPAPTFDPVALAKERIRREDERRLVDAEYKKLRPPEPLPPDPPFDPVKLAKERVKAEEQRRLVDTEYRKLKPKPLMDSLVGFAESIRGTIGGTFGTIFGSILDLTSNLRKLGQQGAGGAVDVQPAAPPPTATWVPNLPGGSSAAAPAAVPVAEGEAAAATGAAASSMSAIVPVAGAVVAGFVAVVAITKSLADEINKVADRYADYNPEIAQAKAMAELNTVLGDMRRAQENSQELAEFIRAQSELQQRWEDVKMALMNKLIPVVTGILQVLSSLLGIASRTDIEDKSMDPTTNILNMQMISTTRQFGQDVPVA